MAFPFGIVEGDRRTFFDPHPNSELNVLSPHPLPEFQIIFWFFPPF